MWGRAFSQELGNGVGVGGDIKYVKIRTFKSFLFQSFLISLPSKKEKIRQTKIYHSWFYQSLSGIFKSKKEIQLILAQPSTLHLNILCVQLLANTWITNGVWALGRNGHNNSIIIIIIIQKLTLKAELNIITHLARWGMGTSTQYLTLQAEVWAPQHNNSLCKQRYGHLNKITHLPSRGMGTSSQ